MTEDVDDDEGEEDVPLEPVEERRAVVLEDGDDGVPDADDAEDDERQQHVLVLTTERGARIETQTQIVVTYTESIIKFHAYTGMRTPATRVTGECYTHTHYRRASGAASINSIEPNPRPNPNLTITLT